ncbi:flagellar motor switch phosphatase FliY [Ureibacillus acetophenoni]|uniref:Flagellar motor switch protein FliN/FliY n=1 Tax=Ureibacillus acetophenoni TaxID=614649 RepID=A0A285U0V8_9BACL|nr:flagellar motor switch phosphatase FliY [Ureibacillus acetophenoni]SOC35545.1 flagellar motor switch protein FliN/FliY [Ureibacillus acetophenoni]
MNDGMLSQEEIEALLRGETLDDRLPEINNSNDEVLNVEDYLSSMEQDALGEIGNISFGSSATALSTLLGQKVDITTPVVSMVQRSRLEEEFPHPYVAIQVEYTTGLTGMNLLVIKQTDASIIADLMLGGDGLNPNLDLSEIHLSAVQEAMNQMMGSAATSMSTIFNKKVDISPPSIDLLNLPKNEGQDTIPNDDLLVKVSFRLKVGSLIDSTIMQLLPLAFSQEIVKTLLGESTPAPMPEQHIQQPVAQQPMQTQPEQQYTQTVPVLPTYEQPKYQEPIQQQQVAATVYDEAPIFSQPRYQQQQPVNVQQAQFASFQEPLITQSETSNLNMLLDIPLQVTVELGRTKHSVKDILQLATGSIIELDKLAGEPVDILVNNRLLAKGEVVVIDENFGVRITDIVSQAARLDNLK